MGKVFAKIKDTAGGHGETLRAQIDPAKTTWILTPSTVTYDLADLRSQLRCDKASWTSLICLI